MLPRFLLSSVDLPNRTARLDAEEARHLSQVLRLGVGDEIAVFDGAGREFRAVVERVSRDAADLRVVEEIAAAPEPAVRVTLAQAVLKGDKMDDVVRDAVMMGAAAIQPLVTARSETSLAAITRGQRVDRWRRIAVASTKQCGRAVVPTVLDARALDTNATWLCGPATPDPRLLLVEPGTALPARTPREVGEPPADAASIVVGPEGGWTPEELGALAPVTVPMTLGHRTLRADRAATVAVAALQAVWNDQ